METKIPFRVVVQLNEERRVLLIDKNNQQEIHLLVGPLYDIQSPFKVLIKSLMAEVTTNEEILENDELIVVLLDLDPRDEQQEENVQKENDNNDNQLVMIDIQDIQKKTFPGDKLLFLLNEWALSQKFFLIFTEGRKKLLKGYKRVIKCKNKDCFFRLVFLAPLAKEGKNQMKSHWIVLYVISFLLTIMYITILCNLQQKISFLKKL